MINRFQVKLQFLGVKEFCRWRVCGIWDRIPLETA